MSFLIDTDLIIHTERTGESLASLLKKKLANKLTEQVFISCITASELLHGIHRAKTESVLKKRQVFVEGILSLIPIVAIELPTARIHAKLSATLAKQGAMIGAHDSWIAASALEHKLTILTNNVREFKRVRGLKVEVW